MELPTAQDRYEKGEIEVVPIVLYPMNLKDDCEFLHNLNPLPEWGKNWQDYEGNGGSYKNAQVHIGNGLKQAIEKVRERAKKI